MTVFGKMPLLGILRGIREEEISFVADVAKKEGLTSLEITMNTEGAPKLISQMREASEGMFSVGAGTVLSLEDLNSALDAGASFVVMPTLVRDVVEVCLEKAMPVFPGALTPQEIWDAAFAGATMVKVFPSNLFGASYFKDLRGPFDKVPLMACGGVNASSLAAFFDAGANAASFGGSIFKREWLAGGNERELSSALREIIEAYRAWAC